MKIILNGYIKIKCTKMTTTTINHNPEQTIIATQYYKDCMFHTTLISTLQNSKYVK